MKHWRTVLVLAAALGAFRMAGCLSAAQTITLPETAGEWRLAGRPTMAKPVPGELKSWRGTESALVVWRAVYRGSPDIVLTVYAMPEYPNSAFDAVQKWQTQPGKLAFTRGGYFGVAESAAADGETLNRFVLAVETALPPGSEFRK